MIISFVLGTEIIEAQVDVERNLSFRARLTNNNWVAFAELLERSGQKDTRAAVMAQRIIKCKECLPEQEDIELFVIDEFMRTPGLKGLRHVKTVW